MKRELQLRNGLIAFVDEMDYEFVSQIKWYAVNGGTTYYARTTGVKAIYLHRFIMGVDDNKIRIDHRDHDGLNNTRANLRIASFSDNAKNKTKTRGTSQYNGVNYHTLTNKWIARINIEGKQKHLGLFEDERDAAKAYNQAAINTGNPFYNLNKL